MRRVSILPLLLVHITKKSIIVLLYFGTVMQSYDECVLSPRKKNKTDYWENNQFVILNKSL